MLPLIEMKAKKEMKSLYRKTQNGSTTGQVKKKTLERVPFSQNNNFRNLPQGLEIQCVVYMVMFH